MGERAERRHSSEPRSPRQPGVERAGHQEDRERAEGHDLHVGVPPRPGRRHRVGGERRDHAPGHQRDEQREEIEGQQRAAVGPRKRDEARMIQVEQQVRRAEQRRHRRDGHVPIIPRLQDGERDGKRDAGQEQAIDHDGRNRRPRRHQHPSRDPEPRQRRKPPARGRVEAAPRPRRRQQKTRQHRRGEPKNHLVRVPRGAREIGPGGQQLPRREVPNGQRHARKRPGQQIERPEAYGEKGHRPPRLPPPPARVVHCRDIGRTSGAGQSGMAPIAWRSRARAGRWTVRRGDCERSLREC